MRRRPRLEWGTGNPQVQLGGDGLIGALAVQLFFACSQTGGLALCASCGTPFLPTGRRRRKDLNAYCSECGLKAALRDAAARYTFPTLPETSLRASSLAGLLGDDLHERLMLGDAGSNVLYGYAGDDTLTGGTA